MSAAETTPNGIRRIAKDLRKFSTSRSDVFRAAASRLSAEFLKDLHVCSWEAEQKAMLKEDLVEQQILDDIIMWMLAPSLLKIGDIGESCQALWGHEAVSITDLCVGGCLGMSFPIEFATTMRREDVSRSLWRRGTRRSERSSNDFQHTGIWKRRI